MNSEQVAQGFHPSSAENLQGQALWATRPSTRLSSQRNFPPPPYIQSDHAISIYDHYLSFLCHAA